MTKQQRWQKKNKEKTVVYSTRWMLKNKEKFALYQRRARLKRKYGITLEEYDDMLKQQKGKCAICRSKNSGTKGAFHVDHNHKTGAVRGLLCRKCNIGLGNFNDSTKLLMKAASYIIDSEVH